MRTNNRHNYLPWDDGGVGGTNGGGGDKGGAPGQAFVVPGPHRRGLFAKLHIIAYN